MQALRARRPQAVEQWFHQYVDVVYTFAFYRVGKDPDLAEEVVQDTFVTALSQIEKYDPQRGMMLPWLTYHCRNSLRNTLRRHQASDALADFWEETDCGLILAYQKLATSPLPEDVLHEKETKELVQLTLASIPGNYREVLTHHYLEQRPLKEIATLHGLSEGAIKSLLYRARLAFKTAFCTYVNALEAKPSLERGVK